MNSNKVNQRMLFVLFTAIFGCFLINLSPAYAATYHTANNKIISYNDVGKGTPLVLIHAFPTDQRLWSPQQEGLKKNFRVITLDLWGFGKSSATNGEAVTMEEYADEVKQLLDHLHVQKAIIGGESLGGYIALAFLKKYPSDVIGLILSNTQSAPDSDEAKLKREETAKDVLQNGSSKLIEGITPKALTANASKQTREFLINIYKDQPPKAIASGLRGIAIRSDASNILSNTKLPVLIIISDQDTVISPQQGEEMHSQAIHSQLVKIQNAGHLSNLEQPKQWNQAVINLFYKK